VCEILSGKVLTDHNPAFIFARNGKSMDGRLFKIKPLNHGFEGFAALWISNKLFAFF
jgi:hypothetical protein